MTIPVDRSLHDGLVEVPAQGVTVLASPGLESAGRGIGRRVATARAYLTSVLAHEPPMAVLVLSPEHWPTRTAHPLYGMPNYRAGNLVLAGLQNPFWRGFAEAITAQTPSRAAELVDVYGDDDGVPDLASFFDLLAIHELMHIYLEDAGATPPRLWLGELTCNLALHAYVSAREPARLPTLTEFPRAFTELGGSHVPYHTLAEFEDRYAYDMSPENYGWYQTHFHVAAARLHDAGGERLLRRLWDTLRAPLDTVDDHDLADALATQVDAGLATFVREWPTG